ncbi:MAG: hypothetical protein OEY79_02870, partial [Anaplasmataceae bacterium]|nr:hypothetical protein [Anaplasmataceae bacterium]
MPNTIVLPSGSFPDSANRQHATNALKALQICEKGILEIPKDENASQTQPNILGAVVFYLINDDQSIYNITLGEFINNYSDFKYEYTFGSTKGMVFLDTDSHNYVTV